MASKLALVGLLLILSFQIASASVVSLGDGNDCGDEEVKMSDGTCGVSCHDHEEANDGTCEHKCDQSATRKHWSSGACYRCDQASGDKYFQDNACVSACGEERKSDSTNDCVAVVHENPEESPLAGLSKVSTRAGSQAESGSLSPCCKSCSKLSETQASLIKADCSGCPASVAAKMSRETTSSKFRLTKALRGMSECCRACASLTKAEQESIQADCGGC